MKKSVQFRDYQEQQADDHNNLQSFARSSFDTLVLDAVATSRRYAGFNTVKTAQAEVQVQPGRFYDNDGAVYEREAVLVQSMLQYLAGAAQRIVVISAYGVESETDVETRDFLVDVETRRTEPQAVATTLARTAQLALTQGAESSDPQPPAIPVTHVAIAHVLLSDTEVVSVTMLTDNEVGNIEDLDTRTDALEEFEAQVGPRLSSLAADLAALQALLKQRAAASDLTNVYIDLARLKEALEIPAEATGYGADRFLDTTDTDNDGSQGYGGAFPEDQMVMEGVRFPDANADEDELAIFSANDPNAALQDGLLLPAYDSVFRMGIYPYQSDLGIAQYGFQTFDLIEKTIARQRLRYGAIFTACTNSAWFQSGTYDPITQTFKIGNETWNVLDIPDTYGGQAHFPRFQQFWLDTYTETYWTYVLVQHQINGAQVAQTFLNSNDMWLTKLRLFFTAKGGNENVWVTLCEVAHGMPNLDACILHQSLAHTDMIVGEWTAVNVKPTFLERGKRYAVVLTSAANHKIGMAGGQYYLDGSFFYSTDGAFYQGDLTKDMMLELWGAKFRANQVAIELDALSLDGGMQSLDMTYGAVVPASTELVFEAQPGGSGAWVPLAQDSLTAFAGSPPLSRFRARFVGTRDVQPGLVLTGSRVHKSRPKLAFKHISEEQTVPSTSHVHVRVRVENFDDTPHDVGCRIHIGTGWETADTTVTETIDAENKYYYVTYTFDLGAPVTAFTIEITGSTVSAGNTFHVAERVFWVT